MRKAQQILGFSSLNAVGDRSFHDIAAFSQFERIFCAQL
jgi:hypothetical protein